MKVLLLNGSPRKAGCTYTALCEVAKALEKDGIETEIFYAGAGGRWTRSGVAGVLGISLRANY